MASRRPFQIAGRSVFSLLAILFVLLLLWLSTDYPPRARYVPQVVAVFSLVCLLLQFALDSFPRLSELYRTVEREDVFNLGDTLAESPGKEGPELRLELIAYSWLVFLLGGLFVFGFLISVPFYVLFYLRYQAELAWLKAALYGVGTWVFVYLLFVRLFEIRLYPGLLLQYLFDL